MSVDRPLSRPLVVVKNAAQPLLYPLARPLVRSALYSTSALTRFAVNGVEAALALDFIGGEYRTANTATTFADAFTGTSPKLTYSTAAGSNSTMTQGYGPELVTDFSTYADQAAFDVDWTRETGWTFSGGVASKAAGTASWLTTSQVQWANYDGKVLQVTWDVSNSTAGSTRPRWSGQAEYGNGTFTQIVVVGYTGSNFGINADASFNGDVSNISVREAPKIVWAPHNLALNSATPATQTIAVRSGAQYTVRVTGAGSMALSGAGTGTATDGSPATITASTTSLTITLTGSLDTVAVYRSDLGGMAQVPGAATGFEYYVPTNGNAEYLPRVGHHVYNGSTWVNEGLLIESEARTNLVTHSEDFTDASWTTNDGGGAVSSTTAVAAPNGTNLCGSLIEDTSTGLHYSRFGPIDQAFTSGTTYTQSVFVKANGRSKVTLYFSAPAFPTATRSATFNLVTVEAETPALGTSTIESFGGGWFRLSFSLTADASVSGYRGLVALNDGSSDSYTGDGTSGVYLWGAQLEEGPTPSSYMPTSGGTYTRTAQSLTVPPAEFGWPEPEYIGPELVDNGDFSLGDNGDWTLGTGWTISPGGELVASSVASNVNATQTFATEIDKVYVVTADCLTLTAGNVRLYHREGGGGAFGAYETFVAGQTATIVFKATTSTTTIFVYPTSNSSGTFDNISVREINPLAVSIQMDGRMTYADDGASQSAVFYNWAGAGANIIRADLATNGAYTGGVVFMQYTPSFNNSPEAVPGSYSPGVNVPYNISSRHGSTFIRGAADGVLANLGATTPTALPDLSSTDLEIAKKFMGTIGTFRQFAGDIGDTGLVTATNPSTEPTLSLTFDGSEGSFYNLEWSE